MTKELSLAELNKHLFATLLPDTHASPAPAAEAAPKKTKAQEKAEAKAAAEAAAKAAAPREYTAEQLEILAAAGITDPATADPQTVAAMLGQ